MYNEGLNSWLQSSDYLDVEFEHLLQIVNSQLASVQDIRANHDSRKVLLIVWIVLGGCTHTGVHHTGVCLNIAVLVVSLIVGPSCIPAVLVLDICAFVRDALMCVKRFTQLFGVQWARPGYSVA